METTGSRRRDEAPHRRDERSTRPWAERAWLECKGLLLDEQAYLAALGRGGAQRMAIPVWGS